MPGTELLMLNIFLLYFLQVQRWHANVCAKRIVARTLGGACVATYGAGWTVCNGSADNRL